MAQGADRERRQHDDGAAMSESTSAGIGLGSVIAVVLSWHVNHSILWAILHAIFSWFYVIYWAMTYSA
jgi:hypothetical protein